MFVGINPWKLHSPPLIQSGLKLPHNQKPLFAHELQEWLFNTKMADEGKVADVEDDLEEEKEKKSEEPPPKMIEVVFKTGKFGMKAFKVEADQVYVYTVLSFMPLMMMFEDNCQRVYTY